MKITTYKLFLG